MVVPAAEESDACRVILKAKTRKLVRKRLDFERLPRTLLPSHYEIYIEPDYTTCETYKGITALTITVTDVVKVLKLSAVGLEILEVTYEDEAKKQVLRSVEITVDDENELMTVEFERGLLPGNGTLSILFLGRIQDNMKGFFRTKYSTVEGEERYAFGTHFEPNYARHAFPCLDEPDFKATFDVSLVVPKNRTGLSNMPIVNESPLESNRKNYRILKFETTPVMPTYLLAFVIGEYDILEAITEGGVIIRAFTPPGKKFQGEFGLRVAVKCLEFYTNYFDIPYPLPKLDLVPFSSFSSGAMENWGLITFRETAFLVDPEQSSSISTQWTAVVIAHEISHQWFGNLVTMAWWTDLWLNEGFATFMQFLCVDHVFPEYKIWTQYATDVVIPGLELDGFHSSHPVQVEIRDPGDIAEVFDTISYCKGAAVVGMLYRYMGEELFRKGLRTYLNLYSYKNAKGWELWECLEVSSALPILKMMRTWTEQTGFPLVKIADISQRSDARGITLTMERFCANPKYSSNKIEFKDSIWVIPIHFSKGSGLLESATSSLMDGTESCIVDFLIPDVSPSDWLKVNSEVSGFYRVNYPSHMLNEFIPSIRDRTMGPVDRLNLLDDLYALVKCGESRTVSLLRLLEAYIDEDEFCVWEGLSRVIGGLKEMLDFTDLSCRFQMFVKNHFRPLKQRLGWDAIPEEGHLVGMFRSSLLVRLVSLDDEETISEGKERFLAHVRKEASVSPDLRAVVYRAALASGESEVYDALISLYRESDLLEEKIRILRALGSTKDPELMNRILTFALTDEVKVQDLLSILLNMAKSKEGKERAWDFFKMNVFLFQEKFAVGQMFSRFLKELLQGFCSSEMSIEVESFFKQHSFKGTQWSVQQSLESIQINTEWRKRETESIRSFLALKL